MNIAHKKFLYLSTIGLAVLSFPVGYLFTPSIGILFAMLSAVAVLVYTLITTQSENRAELLHLLEETRTGLSSAIADIRTEQIQALASLAAELNTINGELATKAGLPFVGKYLALNESGCPVFIHAASRVYMEAMAKIDLLATGQIHISTDDEVLDWLEFLFQLRDIKFIKAISSGEFKEWERPDSRFMQHYLSLHRTAQESGVSIERIFVVKSDNHARLWNNVFKFNLKHSILVRLAQEEHIRDNDRSITNCLVFYDQRLEPKYALVARHNQKEQFESAVIFGAPEKVRAIADGYHRIEGISEIYRAIAPRKTA